MDLADLFSRFAVALGIGLLIGLERGWRSRADAPGSRTAGIRTFALTGLLGGLFGVLATLLGGAANPGGAVLIGVGFAAYAAVLAVFKRDENLADGEFSATTVVAGMLTFALGVYALLGNTTIAAAVAVAAAVLLAVREGIHAWVAHITWVELRSGLVLLAMTVIALPVIPDRPVGPFGGVNPREIWLIAIVLAAVAFSGYAAVRYYGARRGLLVASAAGGLVSSTAVMATNARRAVAGEGPAPWLAAGAALSSAVSVLRTLALTVALDPTVAVVVAAPLVAVAAAFAAGAFVLARGLPDADQRMPEIRNPFDIGMVIGFAAFLGAIVVGARVVAELYGAGGATLAAVLTGLADTDAATVSMVKLVPATVPARAAGLAIFAAVVANNASKLVLGAAVGRGRFAGAVVSTTLAAMAAGAATLWAVSAAGLV